LLDFLFRWNLFNKGYDLYLDGVEWYARRKESMRRERVAKNATDRERSEAFEALDQTVMEVELEPPNETPHAMTFYESEKIVEDFAEIRVTFAGRQIFDANLLPHPIGKIQQALINVGKRYGDMRSDNPAQFKKLMGDLMLNYSVTAQFDLSLFHVIDKEDSEFVEELNSLWAKVEERVQTNRATDYDLVWMEKAKKTRLKYRLRTADFFSRLEEPCDVTND